MSAPRRRRRPASRRATAAAATLCAALGVLAAAAAAAPAAAPAVRSAARAADAKTRKLTASIAERVSTLRGLALRHPIETGVVSRDEARAMFAAHAAKEHTDAEIAAEGLMLVHLGLMPAGTNYRKLVLDVLAEQVAGFYDTDRRKLFLADWLGPDPVALAHEIAHALADQHFDLRRWERRALDSSDFGLAFAAVAEGDAVACMIDYALGGTRHFTEVPGVVETLRAEYEPGKARGTGGAAPAAPSKSPLLDAAPAVLRKVLLFPYVEGFAFVHRLRSAGPWADVDRLYGAPPASTEQVLHPERWAAHDDPVPVPIPRPALLSATHSLAFDDTLGEFQWNVMLEEHVPAEEARAAAAGWGGDRIAVFVPSAAPPADPATPADLAAAVIVARLAFDSDKDAHEAAATIARFDHAMRAKGAGGRAGAVEVRGLRVVWAVGGDDAFAKAVAAGAWEGW